MAHLTIAVRAGHADESPEATGVVHYLRNVAFQVSAGAETSLAEEMRRSSCR